MASGGGGGGGSTRPSRERGRCGWWRSDKPRVPRASPSPPLPSWEGLAPCAPCAPCRRSLPMAVESRPGSLQPSPNTDASLPPAAAWRSGWAQPLRLPTPGLPQAPWSHPGQPSRSRACLQSPGPALGSPAAPEPRDPPPWEGLKGAPPSPHRCRPGTRQDGHRAQPQSPTGEQVRAGAAPPVGCVGAVQTPLPSAAPVPHCRGHGLPAHTCVADGPGRMGTVVGKEAGAAGPPFPGKPPSPPLRCCRASADPERRSIPSGSAQSRKENQ